MPGAAETHLSTVEAWECDDNDHLNIQFYFERFAMAEAHAVLALGGAVPAAAPLSRHVRFHSELRGGDLVRIASEVAWADGRLGVLHRMTDPADGRLAATAVDLYDAPGRGGELDEVAGPRSLDAGPTPFADVSGPGRKVTGRWVVQPSECVAAGGLSDRGLVALISRANAQFWNGSPCGRDFMAARNWGRAVVEMKLTVGTRPAAGTPILVASSPIQALRSAVALRHAFVDAASGAVLAMVDGSSVIFDRVARKAQKLPDAMREWLDARIGAE